VGEGDSEERLRAGTCKGYALVERVLKMLYSVLKNWAKKYQGDQERLRGADW